MEFEVTDMKGGKKPAKKVDKLGRVRPSSYSFCEGRPHKKKTAISVSTATDTTADKDSSEGRNSLEDIPIPDDNFPQGFPESKMEDSSAGTCSKDEICDILNQMVSENEINPNLVDCGDEENVISDEKWKEILFNNFNEYVEEECVDEETDSCSEDNNRPIYPGHTLTIHHSMVLILLYSICHNISGSQLADLLTLISIHCLHPHPGIKSIHVFKKYFANLQSPLKKHFYCINCMSNVKEFDVLCPKENCRSNLENAKSKSYFIEIPIEHQLRSILQKEDTHSLLKQRFSRKKKKNDCIEDIYDGEIYNKLAEQGGPLSSDFPHNISFTWNTDGIPIFKSSKFSIWPFYLIINELPFKHRMQKENMLLCGLWFGESKPFMSLFTKPLMDSLRRLETDGIEIEIDNEKHKCNGFVICGTADLPAKSLVLNCKQFNGAYSCLKCMHPGETFKTQKGGSVHIFPFNISKSDLYQERTGTKCLEDAVSATETGKTVNGIKGPSFLMTLTHYDFVKSNSIDYMHGILLGITKCLINLWIGSSTTKETFSLSKSVDVIDDRLTAIKPPAFITRIPRTLSNHFKYWKASELRAWLFFYSLPILSDLLPSDYLLHYASFVEAIYLLTTDCVSPSDVKKSYSLLKYFVHMFPSFYSERYLTLNMHSLLHLPQCVQELGPLWVYSCFPFEDTNGMLLELFHGTQNVELQITSSVNIVQNMSKMLDSVTP